MAQQISIPKGTRDFGTKEMSRRKYIFNIIENIFKQYAYMPIETPAMEQLSTLMGKYGDEGDKLLFKILNSGDYLSSLENIDVSSSNISTITKHISDKGLRYDLTVPFARFVVQHQNELSLPFKRYQMQPVWRADRPQKGRYREFYQCDVDVIGSKSLLNELELIKITNNIFESLCIKSKIKINNRKILLGIIETLEEQDKFIAITNIIDKIDKIGIKNVEEELINAGLKQNSVSSLISIIDTKHDFDTMIKLLEDLFVHNSVGKEGLEEIKFIFNTSKLLDLSILLEFDLCLARGLNYYTGSIFEVKSLDYEIGSICGGGRYDNLTEIFGLKDMSGVGISFGADRIYDIMQQLQLFPDNIDTISDILFLNFGDKEVLSCLALADIIRTNGFSCEIYPDAVKLDKQFKYANNKNIRYVGLLGAEEFLRKEIKIKNMRTGTQTTINQSDILNFVNL